MNRLYSAMILTISVLACFGSANADIRIKSRQSMGGQTYDNLTMIKGKRQRSEMMNGAMVNITQCDLRRAIQLNPAAKTFVVSEFGDIEPVSPNTNARVVSGPEVKGGKVVTTIDVKDTGERKQMFGMQARRLIITMDTQSSPEACNKTSSRMEIDGWYTDLTVGFDCDPKLSPSRTAPRSASGGCVDQYEIKQTGSGRRGYPLYEKTTMFDENGRETMSMVNEVVELSKASLDAGLFDVPEGYREVKDVSEMYAVSLPQISSTTGPDVTAGTAMPLPNLNSQNGSETPAKKEGTVRIGLVGVKVTAVGQGIEAGDLSEAIKNTLLEYLRVPNVDVVMLEGKLPSAIDAEARSKECDLILYTTAAHKKGGGGGLGGMFGSALGSTIARTGIGHTGSVAGNIAGQIITQAVVSATTVSSQMKAKDEITLEIRLNRAAGQQAAAKQFKARARSDGENILTPIIEQAAQAIIDAIGR